MYTYISIFTYSRAPPCSAGPNEESLDFTELVVEISLTQRGLDNVEKVPPPPHPHPIPSPPVLCVMTTAGVPFCCAMCCAMCCVL